MRQLHVVALSEDGRSVLLATSKNAKTGGFSVPLDGKLAAAVRGELPRPGEREVRDMSVSPKEIQARLRAGESPEQIAASAGVPVARVERFAGPVLSERERVIDEARAAYLSRSRRGASQLPLGDAVDAALAETASLRPESVAWTARRLDSGHWLVQVSYVARARTRTASWVYEPQTRAVTASDAASAALGHVGDEPTPRRALAPAPRRAPAAPGARPAAKKVPKKTAKKVAKRVPATPAPTPAAKKVAPPKKTAPVAKRAAKRAVPVTRKAAPKPAGKKAAPVVKKAAPKQVAKKVARVTKPAAPAAKAAPKRPAARRAPTRMLRHSAAAEELASTPAVEWGPAYDLDGPPTLRVVPEPQIAPEPEAPAEPPAPKRRAAGARAHVPDWADVLLGATPKRSDD